MKREKKQGNILNVPMSKDKFDPLSMILTDPFGSYTGRPLNLLDTPVQDADDL